MSDFHEEITEEGAIDGRARRTARAVGRRITERRAAMGRTQQDLADATGINRVTISRLGRGMQNFGVSQLVTIATVLGCTLNDLVWFAR